MLHVDRLTKIYRGGVRANDDLSLVVRPGEVLGLLGHNGAGKTTLLNQVAGLVQPTSGTLLLAGRDPVAEPAYARAVCSVQLQAQAPLTGVTPRQAIEIVGRIRGGNRQRVRHRTEQLLAALDITEWARVPGERLSGGIRRADLVLHGGGRTGAPGHARRAHQRRRPGTPTAAVAAGAPARHGRMRGHPGHPQRGRGRAERRPDRRTRPRPGGGHRHPGRTAQPRLRRAAVGD